MLKKKKIKKKFINISRNQRISRFMLNSFIRVFNGKNSKLIFISKSMVRSKLGEFFSTRTTSFIKLSQKGKNTRYKMIQPKKILLLKKLKKEKKKQKEFQKKQKFLQKMEVKRKKKAIKYSIYNKDSITKEPEKEGSSNLNLNIKKIKILKKRKKIPYIDKKNYVKKKISFKVSVLDSIKVKKYGLNFNRGFIKKEKKKTIKRKVILKKK